MTHSILREVGWLWKILHNGDAYDRHQSVGAADRAPAHEVAQHSVLLPTQVRSDYNPAIRSCS